MKIQVFANKVAISWLGKIRECDFEDLVEIFRKANEEERRRLAVIHFGEKYFKDTTPQLMCRPQVISEGQSAEWDYEEQEELDNLLGPDPYTMLY